MAERHKISPDDAARPARRAVVVALEKEKEQREASIRRQSIVTDGVLSYDGQQRMLAKFPEQQRGACLPVLKPFGARRQAWDLICALFLVYSGLVTPFTIAFFQRTCSPARALRSLRGEVNDGLCDYFWWERVVDFVFFVDIGVNFNTAFLDDSRWVLDRRKIAWRYAANPYGFLIDFLAIVPFELFDLPGGVQTSVRLLRLLKLVRLLRLLRMLKLLRLVNRYATSFKISCGGRAGVLGPGLTVVFKRTAPAVHRHKKSSNSVVELGRRRYRMRAIVKFLFLLVMTAHWTACLFRIVSNRVYDSADSGRRRLFATSSGSRPTWLREDGLYAQGIWAQSPPPRGEGSSAAAAVRASVPGGGRPSPDPRRRPSEPRSPAAAVRAPVVAAALDARAPR